jgi:dCMP deaminase
MKGTTAMDKQQKSLVRPSRDEWAMGLALLTAERATCLRRKVGCVLLNERGHVLSTGYNGVAAGQPHCNHMKVEVIGLGNDKRVEKTFPHACSAAHAPSGTQLDGCQAIHAEQNALLQCRDVFQIHTAYVTASPCVTCTKLFMNTGCQRIIFLEEYPHSAAQELWTSSPGRSWEKFTGAIVKPFGVTYE